MRRLGFCLLVLLASAACKKEPAQVQVDAGVAVTAPARLDAGRPAVPKPPRVEASVAALTWLTVDEGQCAWLFSDPLAERSREVLRIPGTCRGVELAFDPEGTRALLFEPDATMAWEKDLLTGEVQKLALPPLPAPQGVKPEELAYDSQGNLVALVELREEVLQVERADGGRPTAYVFDGKRVELPEQTDGIPGLAGAYRLVDGKWQLAEVAYTTYEWDLASGIEALALRSELGPRSSRALSVSDRPAAENIPENAPIFDALSSSAGVAIEAIEEGGGWVKLIDAPVDTYVFEEFAEFSVPTAALRLVVDGGTPRAPTGFEVEAPTPTRYMLRDRYLLAVSPWGEEGETAYLIDLLKGEVVAQVDDTKSALFWPRRAATPAPKPAP